MKKRSKQNIDSILFGAEMGGHDLEVDYHGMDVYSALHELEGAIDAAFMNGYDTVRIVHGAGTGKLRDAIHERLAGHDLVDDYRRAPDSTLFGVTHAVLAKK